jgi:hypothetical protein
VITLQDPTGLVHKDLSLLFAHEMVTYPRGWLEMDGGKAKAAVVCFWPIFDADQYPPSEIVFLVDRSGTLIVSSNFDPTRLYGKRR